MQVKSRAIVLHRYPYSDSSWIVKALTEESGVVSFILKGGKRKESPFRGALDPLALSEVVFRQNPNADLQFVKEGTLINWFGNMRANLLSQAQAQVMAEIILRYAPQGVPLQEEFSQLAQVFERLDSLPQEQSQSSVIFSRWLLDICEMWGYHLDLSVCSRCESLLTEPAADFHPESSGLICKNCQGVDTPRARPQTLQGFWSLIHPADGSRNGEIQWEFVENALLAYLRNHIGFIKELNSLQWLQEIRKLCSAQTT